MSRAGEVRYSGDRTQFCVFQEKWLDINPALQCTKCIKRVCPSIRAEACKGCSGCSKLFCGTCVGLGLGAATESGRTPSLVKGGKVFTTQTIEEHQLRYHPSEQVAADRRRKRPRVAAEPLAVGTVFEKAFSKLKGAPKFRGVVVGPAGPRRGEKKNKHPMRRWRVRYDADGYEETLTKEHILKLVKLMSAEEEEEDEPMDASTDHIGGGGDGVEAVDAMEEDIGGDTELTKQEKLDIRLAKHRDYSARMRARRREEVDVLKARVTELASQEEALTAEEKQLEAEFARLQLEVDAAEAKEAALRALQAAPIASTDACQVATPAPSAGAQAPAPSAAPVAPPVDARADPSAP